MRDRTALAVPRRGWGSSGDTLHIRIKFEAVLLINQRSFDKERLVAFLTRSNKILEKLGGMN